MGSGPRLPVPDDRGIAREFTSIWASDFAYDESGGITFPKSTVNFTDKTRYLFHISKGLVDAASRMRPFDVNRKVPSASLRVPFDQMVFVGDGYTDIPGFSQVRGQGGVAIGVHDPADRKRGAGPGGSSRMTGRRTWCPPTMR